MIISCRSLADPSNEILGNSRINVPGLNTNLFLRHVISRTSDSAQARRTGEGLSGLPSEETVRYPGRQPFLVPRSGYKKSLKKSVDASRPRLTALGEPSRSFMSALLRKSSSAAKRVVRPTRSSACEGHLGTTWNRKKCAEEVQNG